MYTVGEPAGLVQAMSHLPDLEEAEKYHLLPPKIDELDLLSESEKKRIRKQYHWDFFVSDVQRLLPNWKQYDYAYIDSEGDLIPAWLVAIIAIHGGDKICESADCGQSLGLWPEYCGCGT